MDGEPDEQRIGPLLDAGGAGRAGRREWVGLAVIALPCLLYSMDLTVLYLAVPSLSAELDPTSTELLWITDIYGFLLAGFLITMGTLGDRIGRRRLLLVGAAAFGVASVLAAFSTSVEMLIVSRAVLGIAAATLAPSTLSLIRNMFLDPEQRTWRSGCGPRASPSERRWARSSAAFCSSSSGGALSSCSPSRHGAAARSRAAPAARVPRSERRPARSRQCRPVVVAVLAVVYGLKEIAARGLDGDALLPLLAGLLIGFVFVRRQRMLRDPLIDLRLFRSRTFSAALGSNTLSLSIAFGIFFLIAQYLQLVLGLSPLAAGLWTVPSAGGFIAGSMLAPLLVRRLRPAYVIAGGSPSPLPGSSCWPRSSRTPASRSSSPGPSSSPSE